MNWLNKHYIKGQSLDTFVKNTRQCKLEGNSQPPTFYCPLYGMKYGRSTPIKRVRCQFIFEEHLQFDQNSWSRGSMCDHYPKSNPSAVVSLMAKIAYIGPTGKLRYEHSQCKLRFMWECPRKHRTPIL